LIRAYEEIIDFIAAGTSSRRVASFQPSEETRQRVMELLAQEKEHELSPENAAELGHYLQIEHLMRLAKARALQYLSDDQLH
jgi:hypothetical protein